MNFADCRKELAKYGIIPAIQKEIDFYDGLSEYEKDIDETVKRISLLATSYEIICNEPTAERAVVDAETD